jgi:broad specificity phosphatase PhoE
MEAPAITRQRRPFLAPIWVAAALALLVAAFAVWGYRSLKTTTVVVVRHAEKELGSIDNSPLAPEGELRAERLAQMFGRSNGVGKLDAIYVSDTRRTQQTAAPLAARLRLQPVILPAGDSQFVARRAVHDHPGGTVLVVGHSNTIPEIVERISGIEIAPPAEDKFDEIYVVSVPTLGKSSVLRFEY